MFHDQQIRTSLRMLVPINRPSSEPLPLGRSGNDVEPVFGVTHCDLRGKHPQEHSNRATCSNPITLIKQSATTFLASITGPGLNLFHRSPNGNHRASSSSVSMVMLTRMSSLLSLAQTCSTIKVLPLPDRPVMNMG